MSLCSTLVLLMLVATALADGASKCDEIDVTSLKDTLRQSACTLTQGGNETAAQAFKDYVQEKHGQHDQPPYFTFAELFHLSTTNVWCRSSCLDPAPENITWCINIAYRDRDVETCIRPGLYQPMITNSTCEAELVDVPSFLSLPTDCVYYGDVGCLGLTNLDWFFQGAYLTCTVETEDCYSKSFTELLTYAGVSQHPEFEVFPTEPINVLYTDQMVIHAELTTTTDRIIAFWEHDGFKHTSFIFEDPFCNEEFEECRNDTHPDAPALKNERIRAYRTTRVIRLDGCETTLIYRLESYLIIDNAMTDDSGLYTFNLTATHAGYTPANVARSVNATISCGFEPEAADCTSKSLSISKNDTSELQCYMTSSPSSNYSLYINKTTVIKPNEKEDISCGKKPEVIFLVDEEPSHDCYSQYNFTIMICAANEYVVGSFYIINDDTGYMATETIEVKLIEEPTVGGKEDSSSGSTKVVYYAVPLAVLIIALLIVAIILILVLRGRKRKRDQRIITHLNSPSLKEAAFFKEDGLHSPVSPGNSSYGDHLEFPRNRLYIYSNKVLGEGSFGRVLQAKAEGIVPGMPNRNIVAIKTTKDNATSLEREELMAELELMKSMEPHENILNLLGYCTSPGGPLCLIVEYATYGNLRDFLRQCEEVVLSLNHMPHIPRNRSRTRTFSASSCSSAQPLLSRQDSVFTPSNGHTHFVFPSSPPATSHTPSTDSNGDIKLTAHHPDATSLPLAHSVAPIGHDYINTKGLVYMEDVRNFALQIACGLQHLATMQIVHCDLAARNILIAEGFVLKIADFGLARDISGQELYKKNPRGKIPVKWTAPEALENRIFTIKSDVWSYGVLLWELFTYGHTPYPEVNLGPSYEGFISYLKDGHRMQQPDSCPQSFYELMRECWNLDPSHRPSPHDIVIQLTPSDSIFDDDECDSQFVPTSKITSSSNNSAGHQSSQE